MNIDHFKQQLAKFGLKQRTAQLDMVEKVFNSINKKQLGCIEAPTGTGKTLAYLAGAYAARKKQQKLIISTATINLQGKHQRITP